MPSLPKQPSILSQSLEASVPIQSSESSDIASAFSLFKDYFDKKLGALKRDIQDELCSNTDSVAKKLKEESKITFRFEGNKKQFQFNSDLAAKVKSASVALGKRKLDLVKTHLEEPTPTANANRKRTIQARLFTTPIIYRNHRVCWLTFIILQTYFSYSWCFQQTKTKGYLFRLRPARSLEVSVSS